MSPVSPKPCSRMTAGPWPPTRTKSRGAVGLHHLRMKSARKCLDTRKVGVTRKTAAAKASQIFNHESPDTRHYWFYLGVTL